MIAHSYFPGDGWAMLCRADLVLGVDLPTDDERVVRLWELVESGSGSGALLDEITRGGISKAPSFVLLDRASKSELRLLARGPVSVTVGSGSDALVVSGTKVSSWAEHDARMPADVEARVGGFEPSGRALPIVTGIVVSRMLRTRFGAPPAPETAPPPESPPAAKHAKAPKSVPAPAPEPAPETTIVADTVTPEETGVHESGYDHLFGETMIRPLEDAAVRPEDPDADPSVVEERTTVASDIAGLRSQNRAARKRPAPVESGPRLFLELSTGGREALDQTLIIGRAPTATRVEGGNIPRPVSMTTPNQDISRTHVQIAVEGGTPVVTDLHSRNGTMITLPGKTPEQLRAGEPTAVIVGTVIDLGDGATLTVREEP